MKRIATLIAAGSVLGAVAMAQSPRFTVIDLGNVGPDGQPFQVTNNGLVAGAAMAGNALHAVLWYNGRMLDLGAPGLKGTNSQAFGVNLLGQAVGEAQTPDNPGAEDFCGFAALGLPPSGSCLPFLWQNGVMNPLPTLGGDNGIANKINILGQVAGTAENDMSDSTCPSGFPQHQFKPVVWRNGAIQELPTFPGDPDGSAMAINDIGQAAGASGYCTPSSPITPINLQPLHALLWEDGKPTDLGTLGGTGHFFGIQAENLNNPGQVIGWSDLTGDANFHAFLWTMETGMRDLGTVGTDVNSLAISINDGGQIVGVSLDKNFDPRAFLRVGEDLVDLNTLIPTGSPLYLLTACSINALGEIIGFATDKSGNVHSYLAVPDFSGHTGESVPEVVTAPGSEGAHKGQFARFGIGGR